MFLFTINTYYIVILLVYISIINVFSIAVIQCVFCVLYILYNQYTYIHICLFYLKNGLKDLNEKYEIQCFR